MAKKRRSVTLFYIPKLTQPFICLTFKHITVFQSTLLI